jgi:hypothetical protein
MKNPNSISAFKPIDQVDPNMGSSSFLPQAANKVGPLKAFKIAGEEVGPPVKHVADVARLQSSSNVRRSLSNVTTSIKPKMMLKPEA